MSTPEEISLMRCHRASLRSVARSVAKGTKPRKGKRTFKPRTTDVTRLAHGSDRAYLPRQLRLTHDPAVKVDQPPPFLHLGPWYSMLGATFTVKPAGQMHDTAVLHPNSHQPPQIIGNRS